MKFTHIDSLHYLEYAMYVPKQRERYLEGSKGIYVRFGCCFLVPFKHSCNERMYTERKALLRGNGFRSISYLHKHRTETLVSVHHCLKVPSCGNERDKTLMFKKT